MIIKCTEKEKEFIEETSCVEDYLSVVVPTNECDFNCEKCFEKHNIKFEIEGEKENE